MHQIIESQGFLGDEAGIPLGLPFTRQQAAGLGVSRRRLAYWCANGLLVSPVRGVLHAAQLADTLGLRVACLALVVPDDCVVTDRTAGWLHGASMILAPNDHLRVPSVDMFRSPGNRLRRAVAASGERTLGPDEVVDLGGVRVTSTLRTTCDLGMKLRRFQAFAGMCSMMAVADFSPATLVACADGRFPGYRWVRQLRSLAPHVDGRFQSPGESALALHAIDSGLPCFTPQYEVAWPLGSFFLDLALPDLRYAVEYDGEKWHGADRTDADLDRRRWLAEQGGWTIDVFRAHHVFGQHQDAAQRLTAGVIAARRRFGMTISGIAID